MRPAGLAMGEASPDAPRSVTGFLLASSTVIFSWCLWLGRNWRDRVKKRGHAEMLSRLSTDGG